MPEFDFYVGGIEDGIIQVLSQAFLRNPENPDGYLKRIDSYGGQLDEQTLRKYVQTLAPNFPLMLVAYGDGADKLSPATAVAFDEPRIFEHRCTFSVICCSSDARSEQARRRGANGPGAGVYRMIADARSSLAGLRLRKQLSEDDDTQVLLTLDPLTISGVEYLARLPELTAYVAHFDTMFKYEEPDRRNAPIDVTDFVFTVDTTGDAGHPGALPGVNVEEG